MQADAIARAAALDLAPKLGTSLPQQVELALHGGMRSKGAEQYGLRSDLIALAALVVSCAQLVVSIAALPSAPATADDMARMVEQRLPPEATVPMPREQRVLVIDAVVRQALRDLPTSQRQ